MAGERSFASFGAGLNELDSAWQDRIGDAEALRSAGRHASAIAMGLYALEIRLKVRICQVLDVTSLPRPFEIHDLEGLLVVAGLSKSMEARSARHIRVNWTLLLSASRQLNDLRYNAAPAKGRRDSDDFFYALDDPDAGVLPWISTQS